MRNRVAALWVPCILSARKPIGGIAAQRDEIRNLSWLDPVALANLGGANPCHLARLYRLKNGRSFGRELEGIPVTGGYNGASLLARY